MYKDPNKDIWFRAQVIKKGVKASNPLPYYNIQPEFDQPKGVNLDEFDWVFDSPESARGRNVYAGEGRRSPNWERGRATESSSPRLNARKEREYSTMYTNCAHFSHEDQIARAEKADNSYVVFIPKEDWDKPFMVEAKEKEIKNFREPWGLQGGA